MRDTTQGVERVRRWPRKRGRAKTEKQKAAQERFKWANWAVKYMAPQTVAQMTAAVQGTPLMPRDLFIAQLYGRLAMFVLDDGRKLWPKEAAMEVSAALDVISATPGDILIRGATAWESGQLVSPEAARALLAALGGDEGDVLQKIDGEWTPASLAPPSSVSAPARYFNNVWRSNVTGDGTAYTIPYESVADASANTTLNPATGQITVNVAGVYAIDCQATLSGGSAQDWGLLQLRRNGGIDWQTGQEFENEGWMRLQLATIADLAAGEIITIAVVGGAGSKDMELNAGLHENSLRITRLG